MMAHTGFNKAELKILYDKIRSREEFDIMISGTMSLKLKGKKLILVNFNPYFLRTEIKLSRVKVMWDNEIIIQNKVFTLRLRE